MAITESVARLDHLRYVRVYGNDAAAFLQRQLTCDLRPLNDDRQHTNRCVYGAWCNAKGRVLADLLVGYDGQDYYLIMHQSQIEPLVPLLQRYILRDRVTLEVPRQPTLLGCHRGHLPTAATAWPLPWDAQRAIVLVATAEVAVANAEATPDSNIQPEVHDPAESGDTSEQWRRLDIQAGVPWLPARLGGEFLPQMLGLEKLNAVSYDKGCYPGQEVIARAHYLGEVKRHALHFTLRTSGPVPELGSSIYNHKDEDAGVLVAIAGNNGHSHGLAVVQQNQLHPPLHIMIGAHPTPLDHGETAT